MKLKTKGKKTSAVKPSKKVSPAPKTTKKAVKAKAPAKKAQVVAATKKKGAKKVTTTTTTQVVTTTTTTVTSAGKKSKKSTQTVQASPKVTVTAVTSTTTADQNIVTATAKGGAVVDKVFPNHTQYRVVPDKENAFNGKMFDCTLNQSDLKNNNNKFYIIQMLSPDSNPNQFIVWNRWGRVGYDGQTARFNCVNYEDAKKCFLEKYRAKLKNGYTALVMDYSSTAPDDNTAKKVKKAIQESKLPKEVQDLMNLIYDKNIMTKQMAEIGYDAKKMPLGKLGKETIMAGYKVLKSIENVLKKKEKGDLKDLSSEFYTYIPHDFGFKHMSNFVLDSLDKLKEKVEMVESLSQIEVATKILEDTSNADDLLDQYYKRLNCTIDPIDKNGQDFKVIQQFLDNTQLHNGAKILEAFELDRSGESNRFKDLGNNMLLWHGSRITNFVGILSQGLRIAPPEAPVSGYRFGKGCYFADMAGKSLGYCCPSNRTALILLCQVSVGKPNVLRSSDSSCCLANLPKGTHSTKYIGGTYPPEESYITHNGTVVPIGKAKNTQSWDFNEYIVYDVTQVKMKYLLRLQI